MCFIHKKLAVYILLTSIFFTGYFQQAHAAERFDCLIEPMVLTQIGSPVQGVIDTLLVDRSELVEAGQIIATLKSSVEQANLEQANARVAMFGEIRAREADLKLAQHNSGRMNSLHEKNMVSSQQRDESRAQLKVAEAALKQAKDNLILFKHDLARSRQLLEQRTIRSPIAGVIVERHAFPGEFIYDNPVMTVAQLNPLRIEVVLQASRFGDYKPGDKALVIPEINSSEPLVATIDVVDRILDTYSGTFGMRLILENEDLSIVGGQKCELEFVSMPTDIASTTDQ